VPGCGWEGDTSFHQQIPNGRHFISLLTSPNSGWGGDTWFHQQMPRRRHLISPTNTRYESLDFTNKCLVGDTWFHQQVVVGR
jgi:hypothetical protein